MILSFIYNRKVKLYSTILCLMVACGFFFFSGTKPASAGPCSGVNWEDTNNGANLCTCFPGVGGATCDGFSLGSRDECVNKANEKDAKSHSIYQTGCYWGGNGDASGDGSHQGEFIRATSLETRNVKGALFGQELADDMCWKVTSPISSMLTCLLMGVLKFFGWLLSLAAAIFGWAANAQTLTTVINGSAIYESWKNVRDLLNIAFILMLLYTAFTIIFQVDKSNKKIILTVVLMALLVNFSFPISRFIIDLGNSLMYTIFNNLFNGMSNPGEIYAKIADHSALATIISPTGDITVARLLASIVFIAILAITFLMMAILFVMRIVILAIIIIFSSVGFVGLLFPSVASKIDWWGNLFKYTFFGPIMAFMIYIAINIMDTTISASEGAIKLGASSEDALLRGMSTFAIPVVVLWIGMGVAQKMGIEGAAVAQKWATAAFNKVSGVDAVKKRFDAFKAERKKRSDEKFKGNVGEKFGNWLNRAQDTTHGNMKLMPGSRKAMKRADKWNKEANKADIDKQKGDAANLDANQIIDNIHDVNNKANASSADKIKRAGQASELLSRGKEFEDQLSMLLITAKTPKEINDLSDKLGVDVAEITKGKSAKDKNTALATAVRAKLRQQIVEAEKLAKSLIREPLVAAGANVLKGAAGAAGVATIVGATAAGGPLAGAAVYAAAERLATGRRREDVKRMVTNPAATARLYRMKAKGIPGGVGKFSKDIWNKAIEDDPRDRARRP